MTNAFTPLFEMQRTMIDQNRTALHESMKAQQTAVEAMQGGMEGQRTFAERNVDLSKSATHAYIDAVEDVLPEDAAEFDEIRATVDDGFEALEESQAEVWEALTDAVEESNVAYEELTDSYLDAVDSSFDAFLEGHERLEASFDSAAESIPIEEQ